MQLTWGAPSNLGVLLHILGCSWHSWCVLACLWPALAAFWGVLFLCWGIFRVIQICFLAFLGLVPWLPVSGSLVPWAWFLASWSPGLVPWFPISGFPDFLDPPDSHGWSASPTCPCSPGYLRLPGPWLPRFSFSRTPQPLTANNQSANQLINQSSL